MNNLAAELEVGGPVPLQSRVGRGTQRYGAAGERLLAGCIPIRFSKIDGKEHLEIMMITKKKHTRWGFPKGGWEDDENVESAARREAMEEGGIRGTLDQSPVGTFPFKSCKPHNGHNGNCVIYMFVLNVEEELEVWPESEERVRHWLSPEEALTRCDQPWMRQALEAWQQKNGLQLQ